jgi:hypothetical protein
MGWLKFRLQYSVADLTPRIEKDSADIGTIDEPAQRGIRVPGGREAGLT